MNPWICLITSLPGGNATARMRAWRALKAAGAAVLHDGVYLLPERPPCRQTLDAIAADIQSAGGSALMLRVEEPDGAAFVSLFDRSGDYAALLTEIAGARERLNHDSAEDVLKQARKLRKALVALKEIDHFPGDALHQTEASLRGLEQLAEQTLYPDEPNPVHHAIPLCDAELFRGRTWATRRRPWVDRLASAWLIRRFIDPEARLLWLTSPADCPADALGFDFDGASFSHVGARVTFEVLLTSFSLETPALLRLGALVHFLDTGGVQPPESAGIESALAGLRESTADDDQLLNLASAIFDGLLASFEKAATPR